MQARILLAESPEHIAQVKALFLDYLRFIETYLGQSLSFQGTEREFADFPHTYDALWVAHLDDQPVGAVGLKPFDGQTAELKRLWVDPSARGHSLGERLCAICIQGAKAQGYTRLLLDTDSGLTHANAIYEKLGFSDIERYYDNPMDSRFMALDL